MRLNNSHLINIIWVFLIGYLNGFGDGYHAAPVPIHYWLLSVFSCLCICILAWERKQ